jgi:pyruvate-ferredoxin/flavodoxin oxidoreductase
MKYTLQVAAEDCTGCGLCVENCPTKSKTDASVKAINMRPQAPLVAEERKNWDFFLSLPDLDRTKFESKMIISQQIQRPLFEFSGACAGCGETPYVKLVSQLFGDRMLVANATVVLDIRCNWTLAKIDQPGPLAILFGTTPSRLASLI